MDSALHATLFHQNDGFSIGSLDCFFGEAVKLKFEAFKQFFHRHQIKVNNSNTPDLVFEGKIDLTLEVWISSCIIFNRV